MEMKDVEDDDERMMVKRWGGSRGLCSGARWGLIDVVKMEGDWRGVGAGVGYEGCVHLICLGWSSFYPWEGGDEYMMMVRLGLVT